MANMSETRRTEQRNILDAITSVNLLSMPTICLNFKGLIVEFGYDILHLAVRYFRFFVC